MTTNTATFASPGEYTWTSPATLIGGGVGVIAQGGQGGQVGTSGGGLAGSVSASITLSPSTSLTLYVAGAGAAVSGSSGSAGGYGYASGGAGGGSAGIGGSHGGAGGGGCSAVLEGGTLLLVAGGGGGGTGDVASPYGYTGGGAGYPGGQPGQGDPGLAGFPGLSGTGGQAATTWTGGSTGAGGNGPAGAGGAGGGGVEYGGGAGGAGYGGGSGGTGNYTGSAQYAASGAGGASYVSGAPVQGGSTFGFTTGGGRIAINYRYADTPFVPTLVSPANGLYEELQTVAPAFTFAYNPGTDSGTLATWAFRRKVNAAGFTTTVAAGSNGVNVSTFTGTQSLSVASVSDLDFSGVATVATSAGTAQILYRGISSSNTLTGCTTLSGTGTLATGGAVTPSSSTYAYWWANAVAAASNGVNVSTFTGSGTLHLTTALPSGFPTTGTVLVQTATAFALVTYTGASGTSLTGCTTIGGSGVLATNGQLGSWGFSSAVWNAASLLTVPGNEQYQFPLAAWVDGNQYSWSVATAGSYYPTLTESGFASDFTVNAVSIPSVTITSPTSAEVLTSQAVSVTWTSTFPSGESQTAYRVELFDLSKTPSPTPGITQPIYDSGPVSGTASSYEITPAMPSPGLVSGGSYLVAVQLTETGGVTSTWSTVSFTTMFDGPAVPANLTAVASNDPTTGQPLVTVGCELFDNWMTAQDSSFEDGTTVGNWGAIPGTGIVGVPTNVASWAADGSRAMAIVVEGGVTGQVISNRAWAVGAGGPVPMPVMPGQVVFMTATVQQATPTGLPVVLSAVYIAADGTVLGNDMVNAQVPTTTGTVLAGDVTIPATSAGKAVTGVVMLFGIENNGSGASDNTTNVDEAGMYYDGQTPNLMPYEDATLVDSLGSWTAAADATISQVTLPDGPAALLTFTSGTSQWVNEGLVMTCIEDETYTAVVQLQGVGTHASPYMSLRIVQYDVDMNLIGNMATSGQVAVPDGEWTTLVASGESNADAVYMAVFVGTYFDDSGSDGQYYMRKGGVFLGHTAPDPWLPPLRWSLGGFLNQTTTTVEVESSDDGGVTWTDVRDSSAIAIPTSPPVPTITVVDGETIPSVERLYRARTTGINEAVSASVPGPWTDPVGATTTTNGAAFISDPLNPGSAVEGVMASDWKPVIHEEFTLYYPIGRDYGVKSSNGTKGVGASMDFTTWTYSQWKRLLTLLFETGTLFLQLPMDAYYLTITGDRQGDATWPTMAVEEYTQIVTTIPYNQAPMP